MTALRHGGFIVDVPDAWSDQSTLLLVAPPPQPLPTAQPVTEPVETITIRFVGLDGRTPRDVLREELQGLTRMHAGVEVIQEASFRCGLGDAARLEARLNLDGLVLRQIVIGAPRGEVLVLAIATAAEARLPAVRETLERVLSSLRSA